MRHRRSLPAAAARHGTAEARAAGWDRQRGTGLSRSSGRCRDRHIENPPGVGVRDLAPGCGEREEGPQVSSSARPLAGGFVVGDAAVQKSGEDVADPGHSVGVHVGGQDSAPASRAGHRHARGEQAQDLLMPRWMVRIAVDDDDHIPRPGRPEQVCPACWRVQQHLRGSPPPRRVAASRR